MRATGDLRCRPLVVWCSGLLDRLPASIDHAIVGVAEGLGRNGWGAAILMRDVSPWLVPEGDDRTIVRGGRYISLAALLVSPPLLIADLHTPARFYNMKVAVRA